MKMSSSYFLTQYFLLVVVIASVRLLYLLTYLMYLAYKRECSQARIMHLSCMWRDKILQKDCTTTMVR